MVELPPPLPEKPSFMARGEKKYSSEPPPITISPKKRGKPLPPRPDLNGQDRPELPTKNRNGTSNGDTSKGANLDQHYQSVDDEKSPQVNGTSQETGSNASHYQAVDDKLESENNPSGVGTNGSHYQAVDDQKLEPEYDEPRGRLNTHSSDPDLTKIPGGKGKGKGKLDPSKRTTLHRSAPSLALYATVDKKSKGSPKLTKSGSTFKLFKRIGRSSKKEEESYEKVPRKSKKTPKKDSSRVVSTSSLKPLIAEDDAVSYVDIDGEERALARNLMDRRDSKRPLPDLPGEPSVV
jgi:hypothetical protein